MNNIKNIFRPVVNENSEPILVINPQGDHKCNEDAICYDTNEGRFFFKNSKEADKWYNDNYKNVRGGSIACSICGKTIVWQR